MTRFHAFNEPFDTPPLFGIRDLELSKSARWTDARDRDSYMYGLSHPEKQEDFTETYEAIEWVADQISGEEELPEEELPLPDESEAPHPEEYPEQEGVVPDYPERDDMANGPMHGFAQSSEPPVTLLVVGSVGFRGRSVVLEAVQGYWNSIGNPPLILATTGAPRGPEHLMNDVAQQLGLGLGTVLPRNVASAGVTRAFFFIRDYSDGAEQVLALVRDAGIAYEVRREDSPVEVADAWASH